MNINEVRCKSVVQASVDNKTLHATEEMTQHKPDPGTMVLLIYHVEHDKDERHRLHTHCLYVKHSRLLHAVDNERLSI